MSLYETIWNFIMTYILPNPYADTVESLPSQFLNDFFAFTSGSDGRVVWTPTIDTASFTPFEFLGHFLTIVIVSSFVFGLFRLLASVFRIGRR